MRLLLAGAFSGLFLAGSPPLTWSGDVLSAEDIVERTLERAKWAQKQNYEARFTFKVLSQSEKLDKQGEVTKMEARVFETDPIDGVVYTRLVEKNGRPLTAKELRREQKRERKFRKKLREGKNREEEEGDRVEFDEDLVGRYDFSLDGVEDVEGRPAHVLSFHPKAGPLPVNRRIDRALNKSFGRIWIDTQTYEISRLEFELGEKIKIWWGFIGSISKMRGQLVRQPVSGADEAWLPQRFHLYVKGRMIFKSLHANQKIEWSDFQQLPDSSFTASQE